MKYYKCIAWTHDICFLNKLIGNGSRIKINICIFMCIQPLVIQMPYLKSIFYFYTFCNWKYGFVLKVYASILNNSLHINIYKCTYALNNIYIENTYIMCAIIHKIVNVSV